MLKCNACGGVYDPLPADGLRYFHACPPLSVIELTAAVDAGKVQLPPQETPELAVQRRSYERVNKRDESVVPSVDPKVPSTIKAEGDGVTIVPPPPPPIIIVPKGKPTAAPSGRPR